MCFPVGDDESCESICGLTVAMSGDSLCTQEVGGSSV